ncbi:MAG: peptidyl-prolyl cis-trans isomerase [Leptospiraceae bacterium]|nr:peptidyl-prolyl cis-trans isomerase [Leptospiraceae bacterium]
MRNFQLMHYALMLWAFAGKFGLWAAPVVIAEVVATVANTPITSIDLAHEMERMQRKKVVLRDKRNLKSHALDNLIGRAIIDVIAREESVTISPERIQNAIRREMDLRGILREEEFKKVVRRDLGLEFEEYKQELAQQLKTQQVLQLRVSVPNPTPSQVEEWYRQNKNRVGKKYTFRMIFMPVHGNELQVSYKMREARAQAAGSAAAFAKAAAQYSQHPSKARGGLMGEMRLDQIAQIDPVLASAVSNTPVGTVSQVFVGANGGYYCVRVESAKPIELDEIYDNVRAILYSQNEQIEYARWLKEQRKRIAVTIFAKDYQE